MNGKRELGGIMSALLAAMSFVGQASADTKKKTKKPDHAAAVLRDRKNRGRGKGGNKRGNKRGEKLGLSSAESRVVGLIKEHPKTSAGLGLAVLGALATVVIRSNSEWNRYYRGVFSEGDYADYYDEKSQRCFEFADGKVSNYREIKGVPGEIVFSYGVDNKEYRSLLSAIAMSNFLMNCYAKLYERLISYIGYKLTPPAGVFCSFDDIETKYCEQFPEHFQKIGKIVQFCRDFTKRYKEKFVNELVKYGEKIKKKLKVQGKKIVCVSAD